MSCTPVTNGPAPALSIVWPLNGGTICASNFAVKAHVDDVNATITAAITDASGTNTTYANGVVERDGTVWAQNLALPAGQSTLVLTATDTAGNHSTTNVTLLVNRGAVTATVDPLTSDDMAQPSITIYGTVSDPTAQLTVNGVAATVTAADEGPGGVWEADAVPVSPTNTILLDVEVSGSGSLLWSMPQPPQVILREYSDRRHGQGADLDGYPFEDDYAGGWTTGIGGSWTDSGFNVGHDGTEYPYVYAGYGNAGAYAPEDGGSFGPPWMFGAFKSGAWSGEYHPQLVIAPSGQQGLGATNAYLVRASLMEYPSLNSLLKK